MRLSSWEISFTSMCARDTGAGKEESNWVWGRRVHGMGELLVERQVRMGRVQREWDWGM